MQEIDPDHAETKERRAPAKKNRTSDTTLEATQEEVEDDALTTGSPPHETKIRQISQGVEDITWQNMKKDEPVQKEPEEMEEDAQAQDDDVHVVDSQEDEQGPSHTPTELGQEVTEKDGDEVLEVEQDVSHLEVSGVAPPIIDEPTGDGGSATAAAGAEQPLDAHVGEAPLPPGAATPADGETVQPSVSDSQPLAPPSSSSQLADTPRLPSSHRRDSDSDGEKGLKRKLGDRTVSDRLVPEDPPVGRNGTSPVVATKRPRDDAEADPNTRERKRPTPPPEEEKQAELKKLEAPAAAVTAPKFVSSSSPSPQFLH